MLRGKNIILAAQCSCFDSPHDIIRNVVIKIGRKPPCLEAVRSAGCDDYAMPVIVVFRSDCKGGFCRGQISQGNRRVEPHIHGRGIPASLFDADIEIDRSGKYFIQFKDAVKIMKITHLPGAVRLVAAEKCAAVQGYSWGRLISNLRAE